MTPKAMFLQIHQNWRHNSSGYISPRLSQDWTFIQLQFHTSLFLHPDASFLPSGDQAMAKIQCL